MPEAPDKKTSIAYALTIVAGDLGHNDETALQRLERLLEGLAACGGVEAGPWGYHFDSFEAAHAFLRELRLIGVTFEEIRIRAVNAVTGKELPS